MAGSYDLILKGGTVVNQDGEGVRDLAIAGGRIAAIGDVGSSAAEVIDCRGLHVLPGRDRQPRAYARARPDPQGGPGDRLARRRAGRRHRGVRDAQHRADHHQRRGAGRQGRARASPHALRLRVLCRRDAREHPRARDAGAAARRLRRQGVHGLVDRLAADRGRRGRSQCPEGDPPPRRVPFRGRIPAARAHAPAGRGRSQLASGVARRHRGADVHAAPDRARPRDRQARPRAARHHQGRDRLPRRAQGRCHLRSDALASHARTRPTATSGSARWPSSIRRCATPPIAMASGRGWRRA